MSVGRGNLHVVVFVYVKGLKFETEKKKHPFNLSVVIIILSYCGVSPNLKTTILT